MPTYTPMPTFAPSSYTRFTKSYDQLLNSFKALESSGDHSFAYAKMSGAIQAILGFHLEPDVLDIISDILEQRAKDLTLEILKKNTF